MKKKSAKHYVMVRRGKLHQIDLKKNVNLHNRIAKRIIERRTSFQKAIEKAHPEKIEFLRSHINKKKHQAIILRDSFCSTAYTEQELIELLYWCIIAQAAMLIKFVDSNRLKYLILQTELKPTRLKVSIPLSIQRAAKRLVDLLEQGSNADLYFGGDIDDLRMLTGKFKPKLEQSFGNLSRDDIEDSYVLISLNNNTKKAIIVREMAIAYNYFLKRHRAKAERMDNELISELVEMLEPKYQMDRANASLLSKPYDRSIIQQHLEELHQTRVNKRSSTLELSYQCLAYSVYDLKGARKPIFSVSLTYGELFNARPLNWREDIKRHR